MVDDEQDITGILRKGLEPHGFEVDTFNDPDRALAYYRPQYYDLVILDVRMPGKSGFQLARLIWGLDPKARICFLSSFEILEIEAKKVFTNFKTFCFIKKPVTASALITHIESHFAKPT